MPGSEDVFASQNDGVQYLELEINRLKADRLGLAIVVIGGLITATVLILFILPSLYRRFEMAGVLRELARG